MKTALVTGASRGFGRILSEELARQGFLTYAAMRETAGHNKPVADELESIAKRNHLPLRVVDIDVLSNESVNSGVASVLTQSGAIDIVVNNAGRGAHGVLESFTIEQLAEEIDLNVLSMHRVNRAVLPSMRLAHSGLLIHISSIIGRTVAPLRGVYQIAKHAVEALAETYRYELSPLGIDSVIIEPGPFETGAHSRVAIPNDTYIQEQYGELAKGRELAMAAFERMFRDPDIPTSPSLFVDTVIKVIKTPLGQRPLRTTVGIDLGVAGFNAVAQEINHQTLVQLGLDRFEKVDPSRFTLD